MPTAGAADTDPPLPWRNAMDAPSQSTKTASMMQPLASRVKKPAQFRRLFLLRRRRCADLCAKWTRAAVSRLAPTRT